MGSQVNFQMILTVVQIAVTAGCAALSLYLFLRSADAKTLGGLRTSFERAAAEIKNRVSALDSEIRLGAVRDADLHTRVSVLESQMRDVPRHSDLLQIRNELKSIATQLATVDERSESQVEMTRSIQRHLLESSRK